MRLLTAAVVLAGLATPALALPVSTGEYDAGHRVCRFQDARIGESSGVASSSYNDHYLWTHNDSGDTGRFFLVDTDGCQTVASYSIGVPPSVQEPNTGESLNNSDIEDMARGKTADGHPMLLLADIGDNQQARGAHVVYEMAEPDGHVADPQTEEPQTPLAIHTFVYAGQPWDAEAVAVTPDRRLVIVTKPRSEPDLAYTGKSEIYESANTLASSGADVLAMQKVANVDLTALVGEPAGNPVAVTSADMTQDGRRFVIRTYTTAFEWQVAADGDLAAAVAHAPAVLELLPSKQGEGIAYSRDGQSLWTSSEGSGTSIDPISGVVDRYDLASPAPVLAESQRPALVLGGAVVAVDLLVLALTGRRRSVM